jgi:hypothetical protein
VPQRDEVGPFPGSGRVLGSAEHVERCGVSLEVVHVELAVSARAFEARGRLRPCVSVERGAGEV